MSPTSYTPSRVENRYFLFIFTINKTLLSFGIVSLQCRTKTTPINIVIVATTNVVSSGASSVHRLCVIWNRRTDMFLSPVIFLFITIDVRFVYTLGSICRLNTKKYVFAMTHNTCMRRLFFYHTDKFVGVQRSACHCFLSTDRCFIVGTFYITLIVSTKTFIRARHVHDRYLLCDNVDGETNTRDVKIIVLYCPSARSTLSRFFRYRIVCPRVT